MDLKVGVGGKLTRVPGQVARLGPPTSLMVTRANTRKLCGLPGHWYDGLWGADPIRCTGLLFEEKDR